VKLERIAWADARPPDARDLRARLAAEGFTAMTWTDAPGHTYAPHRHGHHESLWCIRGSIVFHIAGRDYPLAPGDRLMLPRDTVHAASVGPDGATYLIGERS